jgi:hypothetical protein
MSFAGRVRRFFVSTYATLDERSLGFGRIVLALALIADLVKRVPTLRDWYTNDGLLPNHTMLWSPQYEHTFSFFFMASRWYEVALGFALCAIAYLQLLVGYRTRVAQILSLVAVLSLHGRVMFIQIGGDVALSELAFWTAFLPLGRRYSVDALLDELTSLERGEEAKVRTHAVSAFACFALLFQLSIVYAFNAWQKNGPMWLDGSLVHYILHIDAIVTGFGAAIRDSVTPGISSFLTHSARIGEAFAAVALLFPLARGHARVVAIATIIGLHVGFSLLMNVGLFSLAMIAYTPFFLPSGVWEFLEARKRARHEDGDSAPSDARRAIAESVRRTAAKPGALLDSLRAFPFSGWLREAAGLPYGKRLMRRLARLAVLRVRRENAIRRELADVPIFRRLAPWLRRASAAFIALALYVSVAQAGRENPVVPKAAQAPLPAPCEAIVHYLQLYQGWHMFAPEGMRSDFLLVVDAVTKDGRHVDPWNEFVRPGTHPPLDAIPKHLGYNVYANSYYGRIAETPAYQTAFSQWIFRYHERTGRLEDEIVSFTASILSDDSPPPGEREPRNPRRQVFLQVPQK